MSARLFKSGGRSAVAFAPFTIPVKSEPTVEEVVVEPESEIPLREEPPPAPAPINWEEIEQQARDLIATAEARAHSLIAEAQTRVAQIETEAHETGLAAARAKVDEEVQAAAADLRERLSHTLLELEPLYALIAARAERDLVKLSLEIARKVVLREVTTDPDIVLTLARVALERLHPRAVAKVLLHPDDLEHINTRRQSLSSTGAVELIADSSVGRGGCIVQSEHGDIDARIEEQFARIEHGFFE